MLGNTSFQTSNFSYSLLSMSKELYTRIWFLFNSLWIEVSMSLFWRSIFHCEGKKKNSANSIFREAKFGNVTVCYHRNSVHGNWSQNHTILQGNILAEHYGRSNYDSFKVPKFLVIQLVCTWMDEELPRWCY